MVSSAPSPQGTPSRPPSRQSTRIITPLRTNPNFIRPNKDSRKSLTAPSSSHRSGDQESDVSDEESTASVISKRPNPKRPALPPKPTNKRKRSVAGSQPTSTAPASQDIMDITQDSNEENRKVKKTRKPRAKKDAEHGIDDIAVYFHKPVFAEGEDETDGSSTRAACPNRADAISDGAKLPLTAKEIHAKSVADAKGAMKKFVQISKYDTKTFSQIVVMWLIRNSLPWSQIEDLLLWVAFTYLRSGIKLNSRVWAATEAHKLYCNLQVAGTSGSHAQRNRHAFMGISAAYITADWKFKIVHLGLKYIAWTHKGSFLAIPFANIITKANLHTKITQTTDSGSNNRTMAAEVDRLILEKTDVDLNLAKNHIRCVCHKIALILNAGLKAITLGHDGLTKPKGDTLGYVPGLISIAEESEEIEVTDRFEEEGVGIVGQGPSVDDGDGDSEAEEEPIGASSGNQIVDTLAKVDFVIQKITASSAKRSEFATFSKELQHDRPSLIAGYGIRWNIKYESRKRAYKGRFVINKLIYNERERQDREGGKNFFQDKEITRSDWELVKHLNEILGEFYTLTKKMEGDISSAGMILAEYRCMKSFLEKRMNSPAEVDFRTMFRKMIQKTDQYLDEALACDAILLATVLNPTYRLTIFQVWFPKNVVYTQTLIQHEFNRIKLEYEANSAPKQPAPSPPKSSKEHVRLMEAEAVDFFPDTVDPTSADELSIYLSGKYKWPKENADDPLTWWKAHTREFPVLSLLARDYLACCATSASVERCFSAAADTCRPDRGSMASRTIKRCVSSHQWLVQGVKPEGGFEAAQAIITQTELNYAAEKIKHIPQKENLDD
ncbi:hypothetical protein PSTG_11092 [Puccinia striiformis f. sp. tritici PST-78]|uniref:HAT C-terminal dimerisation domain-containing protein n=1 Tax=Puccinia striiformis f. sp. tritici PST-78 TaxID=1165861 RepID=A0A0L0V8J4_9BASI|nr:hypothetical protein PSTG_11092 [Puccinia striiformis f. sp. tritici PST-78]